MQNQLMRLRSINHMTQEELAVKAGVSRQTIISLEKDKYNPSLQLAFKLSRIFQKPIEEIFTPKEVNEL